MFSVFLSSYRNTRESLGELEKAVETLACGSCSHSISCSPKLPFVLLLLDRNTVHVFYFLNGGHVGREAWWANVSAVDSGSKCPGSSLCRGHCVVFLDEVLFKDPAKVHYS